MQRMKYGIMIGMAILLAGCVSTTEQQRQLAQQSVRQGNYAQAFDQAAASLTAMIGNYKTIRLFPDISAHAYRRKLADIERYKTARHPDQVAYGYDRIIAMNQTVRQLQQALHAFSAGISTTAANRAAINAMLAINTVDVSAAHAAAYATAAAAHYASANRLFNTRDFRQANSEFTRTLSFIDPYKDARSRAATSRHLADLADAKQYYGQGEQAIRQQRHRDAAIAFARAYGFIPSYKNARALADKYKHIADLEDALTHYQHGEALAQAHRYRAAAQAFRQALSVVPGYRDAGDQAAYYTGLANREEARRYYAEGMDLMDDQQFERAAQAFEQADRIVPGFRDAEAMADRARAWTPPGADELLQLVQASVSKGVPLAWLDDVHQGYTEDVLVSAIRVARRGDFNMRREFWPYKIRVTGSCRLEAGNRNEQSRAFDTQVDYRVFRDDFGDWKATFR